MEVVKFPGPIVLSDDQQTVVAVLREWLAKAEKGEFTGIAMCAINTDGSVLSLIPPTDDYVRVIAATALLANRAIHDVTISKTS